MSARLGERPLLLLAFVSFALHLPPAQLGAQTPSPEIVVSVTGGFTQGRGLWSTRQPVAVPEPGPLLLDTFLLDRGLSPGATAWVGLSWFPRSATGIGAEMGWIAAGTQTRCGIAGTPQPDPNERNLLACARLGSEPEATSALAILGTMTVRVDPRRDVSPFFRAGVGVAVLSGSFVAARARYSDLSCPDCVRVFLALDDRLVTWAGMLAAGVTIGGASRSRFRIEARDVVLGLPVVTGAANPVSEHPVPPTRTRPAHRFTVGFGLDLVLAGAHRRRY